MSIMCMSCLRFKFSPIHWGARFFGMCPGDKYGQRLRKISKFHADMAHPRNSRLVRRFKR